ncbi:pyrroloquinoline quinone biosynthesis protein PqqF [Kosakonia sp. H02]|nr:pyrroloquinoline quinone biosynthesis protein PqqF [Kosakonia sp. H02]
MQTVNRRLPNGVDVTLVHQPDARQAAALWCVDAGSLHEPDSWPGLAHLLEHMLFRGSIGFPNAQRLISWVPAQGGRLNASTRLAQTAYFFEVPAQLLEPGLLRLTDMLVAPRLSAGELPAEVAVIDAEFRLLQHDAEKRREAALLQTLDGDGRLSRFRIGNRASFGEQTELLHQALTDFHRQHYHAASLQLFLQGPQSLENLDALARCSVAVLPPAVQENPDRPLTLTSGSRAVQQPRETMLVLSFQLPIAACGALRLLETLLLDETPGGLMATYRQHNLVTAIALQADRLNATTLWLRLTLTLSDKRVSAAQVEALFFRWLQSAAMLNPAQHIALREFAGLAFARLAPLEALRARAIGLPPPDAEHWPELLTALSSQNLSRLWASPDVAGAHCESQGFRLTLADFPLHVASDAPETAFTLFPPPAHPVQPQLPLRAAPLAWQHAQGDAALRLRPAPATAFSDEQGWQLVSRLRTLSAYAARLHGQLTLQREQGIWQLYLCANPLLMQAILANMNQLLHTEDASATRQGRLALAQDRAVEMQGSAVRRLLAQLPRELQAAIAQPAQNHWQARLTGGSAQLHQALSQLLSEFIFPLKAEAAAPVLPSPGQHYTLDAQDEDNALLLFLPLEGMGSDEMQALILRYQPRFFHQMRVECNFGYVAQCQWYRCADTQGVLVALQSPVHSPDVLFEEVQRFFEQQAQTEQLPAAHWLARQLPDAWRGTSRKMPR